MHSIHRRPGHLCVSAGVPHRILNEPHQEEGIAAMSSLPRLVNPEDDHRPASLHAEQTILGAMLVEPLAITDATMLLKTDDFSLDSHRKIYEVILHLSEVGYGVDIITVSEDLRRRKELDSIGGMAYLYSLSENLPRKLSIESYVRIVRDKSLMRQLMTVCDMGMMEAGDQSLEAIDVLNKVETRLMDISEHAITGSFSGISDIVRESFGSIEKLLEQGKEVTGLRTHYTELDKRTSGLQPSELIIIAARPSMGKTAFAINMAQNSAVRDGKVVAVFSLEMSKESLLRRMLAGEAMVNARTCSRASPPAKTSRSLWPALNA